MALDLNHKIFGFFGDSELNGLKEDLAQMNISADDLLIIPTERAAEVVDPGGKHSGLFDKARTYFQRAIGGGPAEFMRDIQQRYDGHTFLVGVEVEDDEEKDKVGEILKKHNGHHIKFFHPMYVEHLTVEPNHDQMGTVPVK